MEMSAPIKLHGIVKKLALLALLALSACAPAGPLYDTSAAAIPPAPPGMARIFFYRWLEPYDITAETVASLNGKPVGVTQTGAVFYRNVPPGQYTISVKSDEAYPYQFKTVVLTPGETVYVRVESLQSWSSCGGGGGDMGGTASGCRTTFVVQITAPRVAQYEMRDLRLIPG